MSDKIRESKREDSAKISSRHDSVSPSRKARSTNYRERSRDRSVDRSSIVSNGDTHRLKESPKGKKNGDADYGHNDSNDQDERGRSNDRKADTTEIQTDDQQDTMLQLMGFGAFETTKGKHVAGVGSGVAKKNKKAKFRQYMNRDRGFNRNLSPDRKRKK